LIADLNNFARYPTLSVGYLVAICRNAGIDVAVCSPLAVGVRGVEREGRLSRWSRLREHLAIRTAHSRWRAVRSMRAWVGENLLSGISRSRRTIVAAFARQLAAERPDVVMISTYLMYHDLVRQLCALAKAAGVPVLLGGPYFAQPEVVKPWVALPGVAALAAGEVELQVPAIVAALHAGRDPTFVPGVVVPDAQGFRGTIAPPLQQLDDLPQPDYSDFPWASYPERIVPVLTGRGCGWGACTFCSDVTSTAGRTWRSRSPAMVLDELRRHQQSLGASLFVFTDLKLNSSLPMWNAIVEGMQRVAPGSRWIASVHVGEGEHGLSAERLRAAAASGCVRLTTGLESGSNRMLERMKKGTRTERLSEYLHAATAAGISTRCTMIHGHPGETAADVTASAEFLGHHEAAIERIKLCAFSLVLGTPLHRETLRHPERHGLSALASRSFAAQVDHRTTPPDAAYRAATRRLLGAVHRINGRPLLPRATVFDGVM